MRFSFGNEINFACFLLSNLLSSLLEAAEPLAMIQENTVLPSKWLFELESRITIMYEAWQQDGALLASEEGCWICTA